MDFIATLEDKKIDIHELASRNLSNSQSVKGYPVTFGIATTSEKTDKIFHLRESVYKELGWEHLLSASQAYPFLACDELDKYSYIFYLAVDAEIIASCRVIQTYLNVPFLEKLLQVKENANINSTVIIERLIVDKNFRNNITYKNLLATVCHWVKENTTNTIWYAKCNQSLTRLYLQFNGKIIGSERIEVAENNLRSYRHIEGIINETLVSNLRYVIKY